MGKSEGCKMTLGNLMEDEDECNGLELTLGLSQWGSKSKSKSALNWRTFKDLKDVDELMPKGSVDCLLKLSSGDKSCNGVTEAVSAATQMLWIRRGQNPDGVDQLPVAPNVSECNQEEIADRIDPRIYAQQLLKSLQEKAQSGLASGKEGSIEQITYHGQFAPGFPLLGYETLKENGDTTAAVWSIPGISGSLVCKPSVSLSTAVKPLSQLSTGYSSLGIDVPMAKKHEVSRTVSLDRVQWQAVTKQHQTLEQQRKSEARKKRRNLIDEQKQQKKLARSEDEKAGSNYVKAPSQIPGSSAPRSSLQGRDLLSSQSGSEAGTILPSSTSPSSKVFGSSIVFSKKLERWQTSSSVDIAKEDVGRLCEFGHPLTREREKATEREMDSISMLPEGQNVSSVSMEVSLLQRPYERVDSRRLSPVEAEDGPRIANMEDLKSKVDVSTNQVDSEKSTVDLPRANLTAGAPPKNRYEDLQDVAGDAFACTETGLASLPLPHPSFLQMHPAYLPISNNYGTPSLMPIPYPYFFQCVVPTSGAMQNPVPCSYGSSPQNSTPSIPRFQIPTWEARSSGVSSSQLAVQASHPLSGSSAQMESVSSAENHEPTSDEGAKLGQHVDVCRPVSSKEPPKGGISALLRAASLNSAQGQVGTLTSSQLPFSVPQAALVTSAIPAVGLLRTLSEPPERLQRQGSEASPFASLVAAVEASQGLSAAVASVSKSSSQGGRRNLECSFFKSSFDPQEKIFGRSPQPKGSCELSWSDIHKSPDLDEAKEKKMESSRKELVQNLDAARDPAQKDTSFRPEIAVGDFVGGMQSSPDLHRVWTTGPNGKTITGFLHRYLKGEIKIFCACHGKQMTPGEFVQHAGGDDVPNPEKSIVVNPIPCVSEAASVIG